MVVGVNGCGGTVVGCVVGCVLAVISSVNDAMGWIGFWGLKGPGVIYYVVIVTNDHVGLFFGCHNTRWCQ